jgi:hypothetical protein
MQREIGILGMAVDVHGQGRIEISYTRRLLSYERLDLVPRVGRPPRAVYKGGERRQKRRAVQTASDLVTEDVIFHGSDLPASGRKRQHGPGSL